MHSARLGFSLTALIIVNLIPLFGTQYANWNTFTVILMYWMETAIIGYFTVQRMLYTGKHQHEDPQSHFTTKTFLLPFFLMHFGIFMFVHLIFVFAFFFSTQISILGILFMTASLFFSHWVSYQQNFIQGKEYTKVTADSLFWRPYPRVIVMHLTVILGGFFTLGMNDPKGGLLMLIILKTIVDALTHVVEHTKLLKPATNS
jgi:hypothetical protein